MNARVRVGAFTRDVTGPSRIAWALTAWLVASMAGCGVKGPPLPPSRPPVATSTTAG